MLMCECARVGLVDMDGVADPELAPPPLMRAGEAVMVVARELCTAERGREVWVDEVEERVRGFDVEEMEK
jgi:hypothetical protein